MEIDQPGLIRRVSKKVLNLIKNGRKPKETRGINYRKPTSK